MVKMVSGREHWVSSVMIYIVHNYCWVQTHVLESCILSHCVIYKSKQSSMCLHTFTLRHIFAIWYKNHCKNETKTSTCREHQLWRSLHVEVFVSYLQLFLYQMAKMCRNVNEGRHIQLCLDFYITQWDKIHDSKTCVWTRHYCFIQAVKKATSTAFHWE